MSGSYCMVRLGFYLLMVAAALLFFVTQVMAARSSSLVSNPEGCNRFNQSGQLEIEAAIQSLNNHTGATFENEGMGGGGSPADQSAEDNSRVWKTDTTSVECQSSDVK